MGMGTAGEEQQHKEEGEGDEREGRAGHWGQRIQKILEGLEFEVEEG
jgi:hypothetical protein